MRPKSGLDTQGLLLELILGMIYQGKGYCLDRLFRELLSKWSEKCNAGKVVAGLETCDHECAGNLHLLPLTKIGICSLFSTLPWSRNLPN